MFAKMCHLHGWGSRYGDWASLVLRLALGAIFIVHGGQKLFGWMGGGGIDGTADFFALIGIPAAALAAWVVALVEFGGGVALVVGLFTRVAGALLAIDMIVALLTVHLDRGFLASNNGYEFVLILGAASIALVLTGSRRWSIDQLLCGKYCGPTAPMPMQK